MTRHVGVGLVVLSLVLTLGAPFTLLLWSPVLLGVPHVGADLYYLVVKPGRWGLLGGGILLWGLSSFLPVWAGILLLHLHNLVAWLFWWYWEKPDGKEIWVPVLAGLGFLALLSGLLDPLVQAGEAGAYFRHCCHHHMQQEQGSGKVEKTI